MLPRFPAFKPLRFSDYEVVRKLVWSYQPFSDFNASCLLSWDIQDKIRLSQLNGNLIVRFYEYAEKSHYYSLLGNSDLDRTARTLLEHSCAEGCDALYLVPHSVATRLSSSAFSIEEEADESDYILSVEHLCRFEGGAFAAKRYDLRRFLRQSSNISFQTIDFNEPRIFQQCRAMFREWRKSRLELNEGEIDREFEAFKRCLQLRTRSELLGGGVFVDDVLRAFSVCELVQNGYAFVHFEKADTARFPGIGAFLAQQLACELSKRRINYINIEQDLGIPGLRANKRSYAPCDYLKKYIVKLSQTDGPENANVNSLAFNFAQEKSAISATDLHT